MEEYFLKRVYLEDRTLGSIYDSKGNLIAKTLELPWKQNARSVSCIPENTYKVIQQPPKEARPYPYFRLPEVKGRSGILIHRGIEPKHSKGCILVASRFVDVNTDRPKLFDSAKKLDWMIKTMPKEFKLEISKK